MPRGSFADSRLPSSPICALPRLELDFDDGPRFARLAISVQMGLAMSDQWGGPGWWIGGDGKWHPPKVSTAPPRRSNPYGPLDAAAIDGDDVEGLRHQTAPPRELEAHGGDFDVRLREDAVVEDAMPVVVADGQLESGDSEEPAQVAEEIVSESEYNEALPESAEAAVAEQSSKGVPALDWPKIDLRDEVEANRKLTRQRSMLTVPVPESMTIAAPESESHAADSRPTKAGSGSVASRDPFANSLTGHAPGRPATPVDKAGPASLPAIQEAEGVPYVDLVDDSFRRRTGPILLALATALAVLSGLLGALWLRERSTVSELRAELGEVVDTPAAGDEVFEQPENTEAQLQDEIDDLQRENDDLEQQLANMSALVLELPPGSVTEIDAPFVPTFADEQDGRLVAVGESGRFAVWGEGSDGPITETGELAGNPTGLFISRNRAWISTEATGIGVLTLANDADPTFVDYSPARFLAEEERGYWTYNEDRSQVARVNKADGSVTNSVSVPSAVVDMTIGAGSVWALGEDGLVYRINTADFTVQALDLGDAIISVTASPDTLWALSASEGALLRVDPVSGEVLVTVPVGRDPVDAAFAGNSVWVGLRAGQALIEVDTRTSAVVSRTVLDAQPLAVHQGDVGVFVTMEDGPLILVSSPVTDDEG